MRRHAKAAGHGSSSFLFVLVLFAVMLLSGILLIVMGTGVYEDVLTSMDTNDEYRTASAYLVQKTRQAGNGGVICAGELDGCDAIILRENIDGEIYLTYLYCDEGALKELFVREGNESITAAAGSEVMKLAGMTVRDSADAGETGGSLLITLETGSGIVQCLRIRTSP